MEEGLEGDEYEILEYPPPNRFLSTPLSRLRIDGHCSHSLPLSEEEFKSFFDKDGRLLHHEQFRKVVFKGGVQEGIRKMVWKYLFGYYNGPASERERNLLSMELNAKYTALKSRWIEQVQQSSASLLSPSLPEQLVTPLFLSSQNVFCATSAADPLEQFAAVQAKLYAGRQSFNVKTTEDNIRMIDKDIPRTDRSHPYYKDEGEVHQNMLRNVLITFSSYHPDIGYVQGMNDIASRFLIIFDSEADAYWCFAYYMNRFKDDFLEDGMLQRLDMLRMLLHEIDCDLYSYLEEYNLHDLTFCHRWLLLNFLREFSFDDGLRLFEMLCTEFLEVDSMEAHRMRELSRQAAFGGEDGKVPELHIPIDSCLTFNLFVCVAVLMENRRELFSCTDVTAVIQCMTSMPRKMAVTQIINKAEELFYSYCQKSVIDSFQILDAPDEACGSTTKSS